MVGLLYEFRVYSFFVSLHFDFIWKVKIKLYVVGGVSLGSKLYVNVLTFFFCFSFYEYNREILSTYT